MAIRTDLAVEAALSEGKNTGGVRVQETDYQGMKLTRVEILTEEAAGRIGKPVGQYVTAENLRLTEDFRDVREHIEALAKEIREMLPESGTVLVIGLGNSAITADALGPKSIAHVLATRHIRGELAKSTGLDKLRSVAAVTTGVLGQTGLESSEIAAGLIGLLKPGAVIAIDALAARNLHRLGNTVQIGSTGIAPGSGVGNYRASLDEKTLGVPVIGIGVPTVVDAATLTYDLLSGIGSSISPEEAESLLSSEHMTVTPGDIDVLTDRAAKLVGMAVNCALQQNFDFDTLAALVS